MSRGRIVWWLVFLFGAVLFILTGGFIGYWMAERIADPVLTHELPDIITDGAYYGMETFDQAILRLAASGIITFEEGMRHATKPADLKLRAQQLGLLST